MSECRCISSIFHLDQLNCPDEILALGMAKEIEQAANTLETIQSLSHTKRRNDHDWETYLRVFGNLPILIFNDLIDKVWIPESSDNILITDGKAPLYTATGEQVENIMLLRQCCFISSQATAQWLRFYLDDRIEYRPKKGSFAYPAKIKALYRKARIAMCEGLHKHVKWFRDTFSNPRITWLIWEYLDLFDYYENFFSHRSAAVGQRSSIGKAKLYELLCAQARREENPETSRDKTDYRYLESFLQANDPVAFFVESSNYNETESLINTIPSACAETAHSNSDFEIDYWIPFTRARSRFRNTFRKDKLFQAISI